MPSPQLQNLGHLREHLARHAVLVKKKCCGEAADAATGNNDLHGSALSAAPGFGLGFGNEDFHFRTVGITQHQGSRQVYDAVPGIAVGEPDQVERGLPSSGLAACVVSARFCAAVLNWALAAP